MACSVDELREVGFSAEELHDAGCSIVELRHGRFKLKQLREVADFTAADFWEAGFSAKQLRSIGFSAAALVCFMHARLCCRVVCSPHDRQHCLCL